MTDKERRNQRRSAEDAVFNRMLLWLLGAVVAEVIILLVKRFYIDFTATSLDIGIAVVLSHIFQVYRFVGLALTVLGIIWIVLSRRAGKKSRLPVILTGVVFFLWIVTTIAYQFSDAGVRILMVLPAVAAVLILIYFLYQRTFFVNAVLTGGGMAALWLYREYFSKHPTIITVCFVAGWIVLVLAAVACWKLRTNDGKLGSVRLMPARSHYVTTWVTCVIVALAMLLGLLLGSAVALYLLFVLIGWLFCQAVFFTVKLM